MVKGKQVPNGEATRFKPGEGAREAGRAGGVASGASRRRRRDMASLVDEMLGAGASGKAAEAVARNFGLDEEATWASVLVAAQVGSAAKGSSRAFKVLADLKRDAEARAEAEGARPAWAADLALHIGPDFLAVHRAVASGEAHDVWLRGGRGSLKSSYISLEIANQLMLHPDWHALVTMSRQNVIREGAFARMVWAIDRLGLSDQWRAHASPAKLTNVRTGQCVYFRGLDDPAKTKAITPPFGHIAVVWFEEADQLRGPHEIRTVEQSANRGGEGALRFFSYNPPRSKSCWINEHVEALEADPPEGTAVYRSTYLDAPREWLGGQFFADADALRAADEDAWRHEYGGEAVGYGAEVFGNVELRPPTAEEAAGMRDHLYGVDWGFSADPFCWLDLAYDRRRRTLYVLDEFSGTGLSNADAAAEVARRMGEGLRLPGVDGDAGLLRGPQPYAEVMCDAAEPKSIEDFRSSGIRAKAAPKQGAHDVRSSVKWLQQRARIVVDPQRCPRAAREFSSYEYARTPDGEVTGRLPDADNHAIDAARYACSTLVADRRCV